MPTQQYVPDQALLHRTILQLLTVPDVSCTFLRTQGPNPFTAETGVDRCPICFEDITPGLDVLTHHRPRSPSPGLPQHMTNQNKRSCRVSFCTQCLLRIMSERFGRIVEVRDPLTHMTTRSNFLELRCPFCNAICVKGEEYGELLEIQDTLEKLDCMRILDSLIERGETERARMGTGPRDVRLVTIYTLVLRLVYRTRRIIAGTYNFASWGQLLPNLAPRPRLPSMCLRSPAAVFRQRQRSQIYSTIPPRRLYKYNQEGSRISVRRRIKDIVPFWENQPHKVVGFDCFPTQFGKVGECEYWFQAYDLNTIMDFAKRGHDVGIIAAQLVANLRLSPSAQKTFQHFYSSLIFKTQFSTYPRFAYIQRGSLNVRNRDRSQRLTHIDLVPLSERQAIRTQHAMDEYFRYPYEGFVTIRHQEINMDPTNWHFEFAVRYS